MRRDRDTIPWLLVATAAAVVTFVTGVAALQTDGYWWLAALIALVCSAAAAGAAAIVALTDGRRTRRAPILSGATAHGPEPDWRGPPGSPHVLVVASEPVDGKLLRPAVGDGASVLVVAPAITSRLHRWVSDTDAAREHALVVERESVAALRATGVAADGHVGSGDPLTAIEDALRFFDAELIVLSLGPSGDREPPLRVEVERRFGRRVAELAA
jgi:hypothetical protein